MRWAASAILGLGLAALLRWLIAMPEAVFAPVAVSFMFGFQSVLASERLRDWLREHVQ